MYFLYLLECSNGAYYTGITTDPKKRWQEHLSGKAAKYTRSFAPKRMLSLWKIHDERSLAQQVEYRVKKLSRQEKKEIVTNPSQLKQWINTWFEQDTIDVQSLKTFQQDDR